MALKILLTDTTRWPAAARLAIGLTKAGFDVSAVCLSRGHPLRKTRAVGRTFAYSAFRPLRSLTAAIEATDPRIVIPCDDLAVQHLHELHAHARGLGPSGSRIAALVERSLGRPQSYPIVSARHDLIEFARAEGLRVPHTSLIRTMDDLQLCLAEHTLPLVMKADGTAGGRGVKIARTAEQAGQFFLELSRMSGTVRAVKCLYVDRDPFCLRPWWKGSSPAITAQAYIEGRPANCAVVCWEGRVLAGIAVEVIGAQGPTEPATVVRVVQNAEMMGAAERIAKRMGLSGFFGLDFMIEERSGAAYLIEMNPRCTPLCHLQLGSRGDMIAALAAQISGRPVRHTPPVTQNEVIAYFPQAWHCRSPFLQSGFQDIPRGEPDLVRELLRPRPERIFSSRRFDSLHRVTAGGRVLAERLLSGAMRAYRGYPLAGPKRPRLP
jgi:hypothetical protein